MHSVKWREGKRADLQTASGQEEKRNGDNPMFVSLVDVRLCVCQRSIVDDADEQELSSSLKLNSKHERILWGRPILDGMDAAAVRLD